MQVRELPGTLSRTLSGSASGAMPHHRGTCGNKISTHHLRRSVQTQMKTVRVAWGMREDLLQPSPAGTCKTTQARHSTALQKEDSPIVRVKGRPGHRSASRTCALAEGRNQNTATLQPTSAESMTTEPGPHTPANNTRGRAAALQEAAVPGA